MLKDQSKKDMIVSEETEKTFDKFTIYSWRLKNFLVKSEQEIVSEYFVPKVNIMFNGEILEMFPLKPGTVILEVH